MAKAKSSKMLSTPAADFAFSILTWLRQQTRFLRKDPLSSFLLAQCGSVTPGHFETLLRRTGFSASAYRDASIDLVEAYPTPREAALHFLIHASRELRSFPFDLDIAGFDNLGFSSIQDKLFLARVMAALALVFVNRGQPNETTIADRWPAVLASRRHGAVPFLIIGDSHSWQYRRGYVRDVSWLLPIHIGCPGGSAAQLIDTQSRAGYGEMLRGLFRTIGELPGIETVPILLKFGQVDVEFVFDFERIKQGQIAFDQSKFEEFCFRSIENYFRFIRELFPRRSNICVASIFPPALSDKKCASGHVNAHVVDCQTDLAPDFVQSSLQKMEIPNLSKRTRMHRLYNTLLCDACNRNGFQLLNDCDLLLNSDGVLDQIYIPQTKGNDHHLEPETTAEILGELVWHAIREF